MPNRVFITNTLQLNFGVFKVNLKVMNDIIIAKSQVVFSILSIFSSRKKTVRLFS